MKIVVVGLAAAAFVAATSCHHAPTPERLVGLSATGWQRTCAGGMTSISKWGDHEIGECVHRPAQYVEFRAGNIVTVMNSSQLLDVLSSPACDNLPDPQSCRGDMRQSISINEARKAQIAYNYKQGKRAEQAAQSARIVDALNTAYAASLAAQPQYRAGGGTCFHKSDYASGFNRVCNYDCTGSAAATTIPVTDICPMTIQR